MWLVLLDRSGSMGDPFEGGAEFEGRVRTTREHVKLEAAKVALREHLAGLGLPTPLVLIAFSDTATVAFDGSSDDGPGIARALDAITAGGGTNVAAAFDAAAAYVGDNPQRSARALFISDGLADEEPAEQAAQRAREGGVLVVDVILIDPTERGIAVARRVAAGGSVTAVASVVEMGRGVRSAAREQQLATGDPDAIAEVRRGDAREVLEDAGGGEPVAFTVGYPGAVIGGRWYSLVLYLHVERLQSLVDDLVAGRVEELGPSPASARAGAFGQIPRGSVLRLIPRADDLVFNPASQEIEWIEDVHQATFRVQAAGQAEPGVRTGAVEIFAGPLLVGFVPIGIRVRAPGEPDEPGVERSVERPLQKVFASYSHADEEIVRAVAAAYTAFGMHVFVDKETLRSGQRWEETLERLIDDSDNFQLFWSQAARQSEPVAEEWRRAVALEGVKGHGFIRPLYWERPLPSPPPELQHLHFAPLDLADLARVAGQRPGGAPTNGAQPASTPAAVAAPVIPLLSFLPSGRINSARADAARAIAFIEEVTDLRYYPAVTLLVDEHAVQSVRAVVVAGERPLPDALPPATTDELLALLDVLKAICLAFHVKQLNSELDYKDFDSRFGSGTVLPPDEWEDLRHQAEGFLFSVATRLRPEPELVPTGSLSLEAEHGPSFEEVERFLRLVKACLEEGLGSCGDFHCALTFEVAEDAWSRVVQFAPAEIEANPAPPSMWRTDVGLMLAGPFSALTRLFDEAAKRSLAILRAASGPGREIEQAIETTVPTYGIYAPPAARGVDAALHEWAAERGIPAPLTLAGTPRVLLCLAAQDRFAAKLRESRPATDAERLAGAFQRSVLVHEHFHAAAETAVDEGREPARGTSDAAAWQLASPLNEALATWFEVHHARGDAALSDAIWAYARAGTYPAWPYAGADRVEALFESDGIDGVRRLVACLRDDPGGAVTEFDAY